MFALADRRRCPSGPRWLASRTTELWPMGTGHVGLLPTMVSPLSSGVRRTGGCSAPRLDEVAGRPGRHTHQNCPDLQGLLGQAVSVATQASTEVLCGLDGELEQTHLDEFLLGRSDAFSSQSMNELDET